MVLPLTHRLAVLQQGVLAELERAEDLLLEALATEDAYGDLLLGDVARWEECLSNVAGLHARRMLLRARLGVGSPDVAGTPRTDLSRP